MTNGVIIWLCMLVVVRGNSWGGRSGEELEQGKVVYDGKMDSSGSCFVAG